MKNSPIVLLVVLFLITELSAQPSNFILEQGNYGRSAVSKPILAEKRIPLSFPSKYVFVRKNDLYAGYDIDPKNLRYSNRVSINEMPGKMTNYDSLNNDVITLNSTKEYLVLTEDNREVNYFPSDIKYNNNSVIYCKKTVYNECKVFPDTVLDTVVNYNDYYIAGIGVENKNKEYENNLVVCRYIDADSSVIGGRIVKIIKLSIPSLIPNRSLPVKLIACYDKVILIHQDYIICLNHELSRVYWCRHFINKNIILTDIVLLPTKNSDLQDRDFIAVGISNNLTQNRLVFVLSEVNTGIPRSKYALFPSILPSSYDINASSFCAYSDVLGDNAPFVVAYDNQIHRLNVSKYDYQINYISSLAFSSVDLSYTFEPSLDVFWGEREKEFFVGGNITHPSYNWLFRGIYSIAFAHNPTILPSYANIQIHDNNSGIPGLQVTPYFSQFMFNNLNVGSICNCHVYMPQSTDNVWHYLFTNTEQISRQNPPYFPFIFPNCETDIPISVSRAINRFQFEDLTLSSNMDCRIVKLHTESFNYSVNTIIDDACYNYTDQTASVFRKAFKTDTNPNGTVVNTQDGEIVLNDNFNNAIYTITNILGAVMKSGKVGSEVISIKGLPSGCYFLTVQNGCEMLYSQKLIIEN